jgi:hypothetical protein
VHLEQILERVIDYWTPEVPMVPPPARLVLRNDPAVAMVH